MADPSAPTTAVDFEKLLLTSPNSSYTWIQYIAHVYQSTGEISAARKIANRAISTMGYREEDEKYNVWVAYLNLEYQFGDQASLDKAFSRAINESKVSHG